MDLDHWGCTLIPFLQPPEPPSAICGRAFNPMHSLTTEVTFLSHNFILFYSSPPLCLVTAIPPISHTIRRDCLTRRCSLVSGMEKNYGIFESCLSEKHPGHLAQLYDPQISHFSGAGCTARGCFKGGNWFSYWCVMLRPLQRTYWLMHHLSSVAVKSHW